MEGFTAVHDLIGGRATWTAFGMPTEGSVGDRRRISAFVEPATTVPFTSTLAAVPSDAEVVAVVGPTDVVVGALDARTTGSLPRTTPVADVLTPAPGTIRPELSIDDAVEQLRDDGIDHVFVTTIAGVLLGIVYTDRLHV